MTLLLLLLLFRDHTSLSSVILIDTLMIIDFMIVGVIRVVVDRERVVEFGRLF